MKSKLFKDGIHADLAQFYPMKAVLEQILGKDSFRKLKDYGTFADWKKECQKLLDAVALSIRTTVQITDEDWREEVSAIIELGKSHLRNSKYAADLFASLAATLARLSFLQIGFLPNRYSHEKVRLVPSNCQLDVFRSVLYVQSPEQKRRLKEYRERNKPKGKNDRFINF